MTLTLVKPTGPTYPEYLENPEAEEVVIGFLVNRPGQVGWLLKLHVRRRDNQWCSDRWCFRKWPCVWWERASEAERRMVGHAW